MNLGSNYCTTQLLSKSKEIGLFAFSNLFYDVSFYAILNQVIISLWICICTYSNHYSFKPLEYFLYNLNPWLSKSMTHAFHFTTNTDVAGLGLKKWTAVIVILDTFIKVSKSTSQRLPIPIYHHHHWALFKFPFFAMISWHVLVSTRTSTVLIRLYLPL